MPEVGLLCSGLQVETTVSVPETGLCKHVVEAESEQHSGGRQRQRRCKPRGSVRRVREPGAAN